MSVSHSWHRHCGVASISICASITGITICLPNKLRCNASERCTLHIACHPLECSTSSGMCSKPRLVHESLRNYFCRGGTITSLAYHFSRHMAATTSSNGDFKIWVRQEERRAGSAAHWRCQSVGNHTGHITSVSPSNVVHSSVTNFFR